MFLSIEEHMRCTGMSREQLAAQMGLSLEKLADRLEGRVGFSLDEAMRLRAALQMEKSIEDLFQF